MSIDVNDYLLAGGAPSAKFPTVGTTVKGTVVTSEVTQQTDLNGNKLTWDNGDPRMQVVITLQTDDRDADYDNDDGTRKLYVKGQMQKAVAEALRQAGAKLAVGGTLAVRYTADAAPKKAGHNGAKQYVAQYVPPAAGNDLLANTDTADTAGVGVSDLI